MPYHVFISYRREGGDTMAQLLYLRLKEDGYAPFFDREDMRSGDFNDQLYARINECEDFLLVLPEGALDRCQSKDDWVRLEIAEALRTKRNIVPFMLRNFEFPKNLPADIEAVSRMHGLTASSEYFEASYARLLKLLSYSPQIALQPISVPQPPHTEGTVVISDQTTPDETALNSQPTIWQTFLNDKKERVRITWTFICIIIGLFAVSGLSFGINYLFQDHLNTWFDTIFFANSDSSVIEYACTNWIVQILCGILGFMPSIYLCFLWLKHDFPTLGILSAIWYILITIIHHLLPHILLSILAIFILICVLKAFFWD